MEKTDFQSGCNEDDRLCYFMAFSCVNNLYTFVTVTPSGPADSGQGACLLRPGRHRSTNLSTRRVKEHRLCHRLPPALLLWHGLLTLVSTNKQTQTHTRCIVSIFHLFVPLSAAVVNGLWWNNWNTRLASCFL